MTREEAAKICQSIKFILENSDYTEAVEEALDMAIEALEQEPFDKRTDKRTGTHACDCISRQAAIEAIHEYSTSGELFYRENHEVVSVGVIEKTLLELPSADRPTGHWIEHDDERVLCECSECHEKYLLYEEHILGRNFCPNCGCAMKGGEKE